MAQPSLVNAIYRLRQPHRVTLNSKRDNALGVLLAIKFVFVDTFWQFSEAAVGVRPIANMEILAGAAVIGSMLVARWLMPAAELQQTDSRKARWQMSLVVTLLIAWMGTLEIDRFVMRSAMFAESEAIGWHAKNLLWNIWWCAVSAGALIFWWRIERRETAAQIDVKTVEPWLSVWPMALSLVAIKYMTLDGVLWRFSHDAPDQWGIVSWLEVICAVVVLAGLILPAVLPLPAIAETSGHARRLRQSAAGVAVALLLICGTLEVDQVFSLASMRQSLSHPDLAEHVAMSIFWSIYAVACLAAGFWKRVANLRYFALALLALTLLKVVVVDLSHAEYGYRVLSFIGLGLLLLGTSVMYGKVSPKLLGKATTKA
jgi:uncharacterized membrane protein